MFLKRVPHLLLLLMLEILGLVKEFKMQESVAAHDLKMHKKSIEYGREARS